MRYTWSKYFEHKEHGKVVASIKVICLAGNNNLDYQLKVFLKFTLAGYRYRLIIFDSLRDDLISWYSESWPSGKS